MAKQSYVEQLRAKLQEKAKSAKPEGSTGSNNTIELIVPVGTTKIRILPPVDSEKLFYHTHSYNYVKKAGEINEETGERRDVMLFSLKNFQVDGKRVRNPIDEFVAKLYATKDDTNKAIASALKRKRRYYCNIIYYNPEKDNKPELRVLVDNSNEGKLMRVICSAMGIPFMRDVEDNWFDKTSAEIDEDKRYFDLVDIEKGHDFKIIKDKTGEDNWAITYEKSFAIEKPRALTEEERALLDSRIDLENHITYVTDYEQVQNTLAIALEAQDKAESYTPAASKLSAKPTASKTPRKQTPSEELSEEDISNALNDDD